MNTRQTGDIGEHYVLYRLFREGFTAVLAPRGAKNIDILAASESGRAVNVQVKTKTNAHAWTLNIKAETLQDPSLFYCLVDLGWDRTLEPPEIYIVPSERIATLTREGHAAWLAGTKANGDPRKDTPRRSVRDDKTLLADFPDGWLQPYREAWSLLEADEEEGR